ncbi:hypothetical protein HMN09_00920200 [Mycena chlorophos]|uniref:Uncharacterized protein n=1 Tax=Mycena chlorophos TaxID=658473 RepID=A0A8H6W5U1_MYCCL|nr:hypothetical protein HMN09_00920200 [Mycena chlorophos]
MSTSSMNTDNNDNLFGLDRSDRAIVRFLHYHTGWFGTVLALAFESPVADIRKVIHNHEGVADTTQDDMSYINMLKMSWLIDEYGHYPTSKTRVVHPEFPEWRCDPPTQTKKASSSLTAKAARDTAQKVAKATTLGQVTRRNHGGVGTSGAAPASSARSRFGGTTSPEPEQPFKVAFEFTFGEGGKMCYARPNMNAEAWLPIPAGMVPAADVFDDAAVYNSE